MRRSRLLIVAALLPVFGMIFFFAYMTLGFFGVPGVSEYLSWYWSLLSYVLPLPFVLSYLAVAWLVLRKKDADV